MVLQHHELVLYLDCLLVCGLTLIPFLQIHFFHYHQNKEEEFERFPRRGRRGEREGRERRRAGDEFLGSVDSSTQLE